MTYPYGARDLEGQIGACWSLDIGATTASVNLADELGLSVPTQIEILADGAEAFLYQGDTEALAPGFVWPTHKFKLLANERIALELRSLDHCCFACIQAGVGTGTLRITETRLL